MTKKGKVTTLVMIGERTLLFDIENKCSLLIEKLCSSSLVLIHDTKDLTGLNEFKSLNSHSKLYHFPWFVGLAFE